MEALLETERLTLRPLATSDAQRIVDFIGDYDVAKMLSRVPYPYTHADAQAFLSHYAQTASEIPASEIPPTSIVRAIDMDGLIGVISISEIRSIEGGTIGVLGYWLAKPSWGKGLMTEAAGALVRHAFEDLGMAGLSAGHFKENFRSGRVLAKLGFRYAGEGLRYSRARSADVVHVDVVLTRAQWQAFNLARCA
jgi:ribosomal-protein-alanine N-acetyltransferase